MRRTLFLLAVLAPCAALVGILWDQGWAPFRTAAKVAERKVGDGVANPSSRPALVSIVDGSGEHLLVQRTGRVVIDGAPVDYPASYAYARGWVRAGEGVVLAQEPIVLFNDAPRSEHDRSRLFVLDTAAGPEAAGRNLDLAFGSHSGIRSDEATIHGAAEPPRLSSIDFAGNVVGLFVDPEVPGDRVRIETERLQVAFEEGRVSVIRTDAPFRITRPAAGDLTLSARGMEVYPDQGVAKLFHDVLIDVIPPEGMDAARTPVRITTTGAIAIAMGRSKAADSRPLVLAGSRISADDGATFSQGDLRAAARSASIVLDEAAKVASIELLSRVVVTTPEMTVEGERLVVRPSDRMEFARLEGSPIVARPGAATFVPANLGDDARLSTTGVVVVSGSGPAAGGSTERSIAIGPVVTIEGTGGRLDARTVTVIVTHGVAGGATFRATFEEVEARDAESEVRAKVATVTRSGPPAALDDVIAFPQQYDIRYRPPARPADEPVAAPESRRDIPAITSGPLRLSGAGGLTITRPVYDWRPLIAVAREPFRLEVLDAKTSKIQAALDAAGGTLTIACTAPGLRPGAPNEREIAAFTAEGRVRIDIPDRALARGDLITYDGRSREVVLVGRGTDDPARIERTATGATERLIAGRIKFEPDLFRLTATQSVRADVIMSPLPWMGTDQGVEPVATEVFCQRLVASFDAERFGRGEAVPTEVLAEIAVRLQQPGRRLSGDLASFDLAHRTGVGRGSPLKYDVVREVDGVPLDEGLTCPSIVLDERRILVEGPADARLNVRPLLSGGLPRFGGETKPSEQTGPAPHEPLALKCRGRVLVTNEFIRCEGRSEMEQGHPGAPGVRSAADTVTVFLVQDPAKPGATPDLGLMVLSGNASFRSPDMEAGSDVMKLNRVTKHATLLNERPEKLSVILKRAVVGSEVRNGVARLDIDFTDPNNPAVTAFDHDVETEIAPPGNAPR